MKTATVRGIPDEVYDRVKQQADRDRRSVNAQILYILERATDTEEAKS
jgi:hypothetical protein